MLVAVVAIAFLVFTLNAAGLDEAGIEAMLARREAARRERNFRLADEIRDQLKENGIIIEDTPQGPRWRRG